MGRQILKVREARQKLAAQINRAIGLYRDTTELEAALLGRIEHLGEEMTRMADVLNQIPHKRIH